MSSFNKILASFALLIFTFQYLLLYLLLEFNEDFVGDLWFATHAFVSSLPWVVASFFVRGLEKTKVHSFFAVLAVFGGCALIGFFHLQYGGFRASQMFLGLWLVNGIIISPVFFILAHLLCRGIDFLESDS